MAGRVGSSTGITSTGAQKGIDYDLSITAVPRVRIISGEQSGTAIIKDVNVTTYSPASIANEFDIVITEYELQDRLSVENLTPDLITLDDDLRATAIGTGLAKVLIITKYTNFLLSQSVSISVGQTTNTFNSWVKGSLGKHVYDTIIDAISGKTPSESKPIFSDSEKTIYNELNWARQIAPISFLSTRTPNCIVISPNLAICAKHYVPSSGRWVAEDGTVHVRTFSSSVPIANTDITLLELSSPLPDTVIPARLPPSNLKDYVPGISYRRFLCMITDQEKKAIGSVIDSLSGPILSHTVPQTGTDFDDFYERIIAGDSGGGILIPVLGEWVVLSEHWTALSGPNYNNFLTELEAAAVQMGQTLPSPIDLSEFIDYTRPNLIKKSQALNESPWTSTNGVTATANAAEAPDGTTTANLLQATQGSMFAYREQTISDLTTETHVLSAYFKAVNTTGATLQLRDFTANTHRGYVHFNPSTGVILDTSGGVVSTTEDVGNGWYRISVTCIGIVPANSNRVIIYPDRAGSVASGDKLLVWGVQLQIGDSVSGYQSTD